MFVAIDASEMRRRSRSRRSRFPNPVSVACGRLRASETAAGGTTGSIPVIRRSPAIR